MNQITYETTAVTGGYRLNVKLGRKIVGRIAKAEGGWRYIPTGAPPSMMGAIMPTVADVKRSIEGGE